MTTCFVRPSISEMYARISAAFTANVLGGAPIIPESIEYFLTGNDLAAMELYYSLSQKQWDQTQDPTACCDALIANNAPFGFVPEGASFTNGYANIVGGPPNDLIPPTLQIQIGSSTYNLSTATNSNPANLDSNGNATLLFQSQVPGLQVNLDTNTSINQLGTISSVTATILVVPPGWPSNVIPQGLFCGGNDPESCDAFRARIIARKKFQPVADSARLQREILTWPCVTRVMQRTCGDCCNDGQLQFYAFMDNSFPNGIVPSSALSGLQTFIFGATSGLGQGKAPVGIFGSFFVVAPVTVDIMFYQMTCISPSQFTLIQQLIGQLFATLTPGETVKSKWIDAIIISVNPNCTDYVMQVTISNPLFGSIDCNGNLAPICDVLPVIGTINYSIQNANP